MKLRMTIVTAFVLTCLTTTSANAQTRDEKVINDRQRLEDDKAWYYDDLEKGIAAAATASKPLMVVLRCIP